MVESGGELQVHGCGSAQDVVCARGEGILPSIRGQDAHDTQGRDALATTGLSLPTGHCTFYGPEWSMVSPDSTPHEGAGFRRPRRGQPFDPQGHRTAVNVPAGY